MAIVLQVERRALETASDASPKSQSPCAISPVREPLLLVNRDVSEADDGHPLRVALIPDRQSGAEIIQTNGPL